MGPNDFSKSMAVVRRVMAKPGKWRSKVRRSFCSYLARAAFFADGERRSRSRQISSRVGCDCPSRCTASLSVPFFTSASSTRRTVVRSTDQRCNRPLLYSPEIEYLPCPKSKATAPSSRTTAPEASLRNSCTVRVRASGVTSELSTLVVAESVTSDHHYRRVCGRYRLRGPDRISCGIIKERE